jgi:DNA-directed RNA polymerase specialized sigma24 family protein
LTILLSGIAQDGLLEQEAFRLIAPIQEDEGAVLCDSVSRIVGDADEAKDVVAEALLRTCTRLAARTPADLIGAFDDSLDNVKGYVWVIARNLALGELKRSRRTGSSSARRNDGQVAPDSECLGPAGGVGLEETHQETLIDFHLALGGRLSRKGVADLQRRRALRRVLMAGLGYTAAELLTPAFMRSELLDREVRAVLARILGEDILPWIDEHMEALLAVRWLGPIGKDSRDGQELLCKLAEVPCVPRRSRPGAGRRATKQPAGPAELK